MTAQLPAWLTSLVDQRMALIDGAVPALSEVGVIFTYLTEPREGATPQELERWERTCDCCGKYCPSSLTTFYTGTLQRTSKHGLRVIVSFGVCEEHSFYG